MTLHNEEEKSMAKVRSGDVLINRVSLEGGTLLALYFTQMAHL